MVAANRIHLAAMVKNARFIYITGCDGTGKSTQATILLEKFHKQGMKTKHLWSRFPFFLSIPLLAYARWCGFSKYEVIGNTRHGYWDFQNSWVMRNFFPWAYCIDALVSTWKIYYYLFIGMTIVCERFVLDMLVDLSVALNDDAIFHNLPGKFLVNLLPKHSMIILLDLDAVTIKKRRSDLLSDRRLETRLEKYSLLASAFSLPVVSSTNSIEEVNQSIQGLLTL